MLVRVYNERFSNAMSFQARVDICLFVHAGTVGKECDCSDNVHRRGRGAGTGYVVVAG